MFSVSQADLRRICDVCHPLRCESTRFSINGVLFIDRGEYFEAVGTDSRQMAIVQTNSKGNGIDASIDLAKLYAKRASLRTSAHNQMVEVTVGFGCFVFTWKNSKGKEFQIECPVIEGKFPKYESLIPDPKDAEGSIELKPKEWVERWEIAPNVDGFLFSTDVDEKKVTIVPQPWEFTFDIKEGTKVPDIILNTKFLMGHLDRLNDTSVQMRFYGEDKPIRIDSLQTVYILMPLAKEK